MKSFQFLKLVKFQSAQYYKNLKINVKIEKWYFESLIVDIIK